MKIMITISKRNFYSSLWESCNFFLSGIIFFQWNFSVSKGLISLENKNIFSGLCWGSFQVRLWENIFIETASPSGLQHVTTLRRSQLKIMNTKIIMLLGMIGWRVKWSISFYVHSGYAMRVHECGFWTHFYSVHTGLSGTTTSAIGKGLVWNVIMFTALFPYMNEWCHRIPVNNLSFRANF